ncbi:MAG: protein-L-isoaspartate(D-aspartate) O-methyltransferase [Bacteroidia bacterium]
MLDNLKHKALRERLVLSLMEKGIQDENVLAAIQKVPRHWFVESALHDLAYEDRALPLAEGQTISQPFTVAYQSELLAMQKGMKVLEIGTGSGYQCAILCAMGMNVYSVEIHRKLHQAAKEVLAEMEYSPTLYCHDGSGGWEKYAPYHRIIVTAACKNIPEPLKKQLVIGGKMILPVGNLQLQQMCLVEKIDKEEYTIQRLDKFSFVPLTGKFGFF